MTSKAIFSIVNFRLVLTRHCPAIMMMMMMMGRGELHQLLRATTPLNTPYHNTFTTNSFLLTISYLFPTITTEGRRTLHLYPQ